MFKFYKKFQTYIENKSSLKNLIANVFSNFSRIFVTLFFIPFYIEYLGVDLYSDWILLISISQLFQISNFGLNQSVTAKFSLLFNENKILQSKKTQENGSYIILFIWLFLIITILVVSETVNILSFLKISSLNSNQVFTIILALTTKLFIEMLSGIFSSIYTACNKLHISIYVRVIQYFLEYLLIFVLIINSVSLDFISILLCLPSLFSLIYFYSYNQYKINFTPKIKLDIEEIKSLLVPSAGFTFLTIKNFLFNQGIILIIKRYYSNEDVVIFNTLKVLTNYILTIQNIISSSISPSIILYYSKNKIDLFKKLYFKSHTLNIGIVIVMSLFIYLFQDIIWTFWIEDKININSFVLNILILTQIVHSFTRIKISSLTSTNNHFTYSYISLIISLIIIIGMIYLSIFKLISFNYLVMLLLLYEIGSYLILKTNIWKDFINKTRKRQIH
jgi:O-antigen/teichoic acid export membrane protein|tara:strand:+ start:20248 stop:21588 length:1341 start_codon:yes stop_codon:yes gene_type:complete